MLVLPETDLEGARVAAERLRSAVEALEVSLPAGETLRVTVSAGCSVLAPGYSTDMDQLQRDADVALYRAKSLGRNRVELAERRST